MNAPRSSTSVQGPTTQDMANALERAILSQEAFAARVERANPSDPYAALLVHDDIELLRALLDGVSVHVDARPQPVSLTAEDAAFLAARLRRLFAHFNYPLPAFAANDAQLIGIAGSAIGAVLASAAGVGDKHGD